MVTRTSPWLQALVGITRLRACTGSEPASMNPEHQRQLARLLRRSGRIDVQVQAILIRTGVVKQIVLPDMPLLATGAELCRIAHALPRRRRLREPSSAV